MEKLHLVTQHKNLQINKEGMQQHVNTQTKILGATSLRKVYVKSEVVITGAELSKITLLFSDYGIKKPGWLRRKFRINQRRRKTLNDLLSDAGVDESYCGHCMDLIEWSALLHSVWHEINEVKKCK